MAQQIACSIIGTASSTASQSLPDSDIPCAVNHPVAHTGSLCGPHWHTVWRSLDIQECQMVRGWVHILQSPSASILQGYYAS